MSSYLHTKICEIPDPQFQSMVNELSICIDYPVTKFVNYPLSYMLMVIVRENRALTQLHMPFDGVLAMKVNKLSPAGVLHSVCSELARLAGSNIDCFYNKSVRTLIKQTHKFTCPSLPRERKPKPWQRMYQSKIELINRRRKNGSL